MSRNQSIRSVKRQDNIWDTRIFTYERFLALLLIVSVFVTTFYFRDNISSLYTYLNLPFYIALVLVVIHYDGRLDVTMSMLWLLMSCLFLFAELQAGTSITDAVQYFVLYCFPLLFIQFSMGADPSKKKFFAMLCIQLINVVTGIVFIILLADLATGSAVMRYIAVNIMPGLSTWIEGGIMSRHASIWGHYLLTAGFYLTFYYLNIAYQKIYGSWLINVWLLYGIASIGILSTGGKTALVIYLVSVVWLTLTGRHRIRDAVLLTIFFLVLYALGAFDVVLDRFGAQDLSSGRNDAIAAIFSAESPRLLTGYGENFMRHMSAYVTPTVVAVASEYSFVALAYKFGILFVLLMIILFLYRPFRISRTTGHWTTFFMTAMLVFYFTTFNAFAVSPDAYSLVVLFVLITVLCEQEGEQTNV